MCKSLLYRQASCLEMFRSDTMKKGEFEAKSILEKLGVQFDESYYDDNSRNSMADFKYKNGRFLEVTHTRHIV